METAKHKLEYEAIRAKKKKSSANYAKRGEAELSKGHVELIFQFYTCAVHDIQLCEGIKALRV